MSKKAVLIKAFILFMVLSLVLTGCQGSNNTAQKNDVKELVVYCGVTMVRPITDIAKVIESQENCKITIPS